MDLGSLIVLLKLAQDSGFTVSPQTEPTAPPKELAIGDNCPQDNTTLPLGTHCVNGRVQPRL